MKEFIYKLIKSVKEFFIKIIKILVGILYWIISTIYDILYWIISTIYDISYWIFSTLFNLICWLGEILLVLLKKIYIFFLIYCVIPFLNNVLLPCSVKVFSETLSLYDKFNICLLYLIGLFLVGYCSFLLLRTLRSWYQSHRKLKEQSERIKVTNNALNFFNIRMLGAYVYLSSILTYHDLCELSMETFFCSVVFNSIVIFFYLFWSVFRKHYKNSKK